MRSLRNNPRKTFTGSYPKTNETKPKEKVNTPTFRATLQVPTHIRKGWLVGKQFTTTIAVYIQIHIAACKHYTGTSIKLYSRACNIS